MADKPTPLVLATREPNQSAIMTLRRWLAMAKAGDITGVIVLGVSPVGGYTRSSGGDMKDADAAYLAQLTIVQAMKSAQLREQPFEPPDVTDDDE